MIRTLLIASATIFAGSAVAQPAYTAAEMQALLAKGLAVASSDLDGGKVFTARITLGADGKLSGALTPAGRGERRVEAQRRAGLPHACADPARGDLRDVDQVRRQAGDGSGGWEGREYQ